MVDAPYKLRTLSDGRAQMSTRPKIDAATLIAFTHERLLRAACAEMAEKGPRITVADIVARAGVARNTFYEHWGKDAGGGDGCRQEVLRWAAAALFDAYAEGGGEGARSWARENPNPVIVLLQWGRCMDAEFMCELEDLAGDNLQVSEPVIGGAIQVLRGALARGRDLDETIGELEPFVNLYRESE
jgi:AcrR family transcriptional regulator